MSPDFLYRRPIVESHHPKLSIFGPVVFSGVVSPAALEQIRSLGCVFALVGPSNSEMACFEIASLGGGTSGLVAGGGGRWNRLATTTIAVTGEEKRK